VEYSYGFYKVILTSSKLFLHSKYLFIDLIYNDNLLVFEDFAAYQFIYEPNALTLSILSPSGDQIQAKETKFSFTLQGPSDIPIHFLSILLTKYSIGTHENTLSLSYCNKQKSIIDYFIKQKLIASKQFHIKNKGEDEFSLFFGKCEFNYGRNNKLSIAKLPIVEYKNKSNSCDWGVFLNSILFY
jgi:hypothetical protein